MMMLSKKQISILKPYECHFKSAQSGYIRGVYQVDINIMQPIYESLGFHLGSPNCSQCVLTMCRDLGKIYFSDLDGKK